jgi:hypothetical protein
MTEKDYENHTDDSRNLAYHHTEQFEVAGPNTETPLTFALRINGNYYISFKKDDCNSHIM